VFWISSAISRQASTYVIDLTGLKYEYGDIMILRYVCVKWTHYSPAENNASLHCPDSLTS